MLIGYGQLVQHAITPAVKLGSNATMVLDSHVAVAADVTHIMSGPDLATGPKAINTNGDFDHRIGTELRIDQNAMNGRLKAQYVVGGNVMVGQSDVRNADPGSYTAIPLNVYVGARATMDVGGLTLFGQSMAVLDQMGARNKVEVGVATRGSRRRSMKRDASPTARRSCRTTRSGAWACRSPRSRTSGCDWASTARFRSKRQPGWRRAPLRQRGDRF